MKHVVLTTSLKYLTQKDAGLCYLDTHAGAGGYELHLGFAQKTGESLLGIAKLWGARDAPEAVANYLELVRRFNAGDELRRYPGSPWFAAQLLRPQDRLALCELHASDFPLLEKMFAQNKRARCYAADGYDFSAGLVPPIERRGLILMDPAYELANEYETALAAISKLHRQFSTGTYALWYPILNEQRTMEVRRFFESHAIRDVLHLALRISDHASFPGMYGSAMVVINPPWTLRASMEAALPWLVDRLGLNSKAEFRIEQWVGE